MTTETPRWSEQENRLRLMTVLNVTRARKETEKKKKNQPTPWHRLAAKARKKQKLQQDSTPTTQVDDGAEAADEDVDVFGSHFGSGSALAESEAPMDSHVVKYAGGNTAFFAHEPREGRKTHWRTQAVHSLLQWYGDVASKSSDPVYDAAMDRIFGYQDVFVGKEDKGKNWMHGLTMHVLNHVFKTRREIIGNNEYLSKHPEAVDDETKDFRDQSLTRPNVLVLFPFRNKAKAFVENVHLMSGHESCENLERFQAEFGLPEGAEDKIAENAGNLPEDHVDTFVGNIDDTFRLGVQLRKSSVKLYSMFYTSDIIVASPLGLRTLIEDEKDSDFLSSIEVCIVNEADTVAMQNWAHLEYVFDHMNLQPRESHGCDYTRVKSWYLDLKARYLRQTIISSSYEEPRMTALFQRQCMNRAGRVKVLPLHVRGVLGYVPSAVEQEVVRYVSPDLFKDDDVRFEAFKKTFTDVMESADPSEPRQMVLFVPTYFDFVRLQKHFRDVSPTSVAAISEYSPVPDITRARTQFFNKEVDVLMLTERLHFYRRYVIRGARSFFFYGLPEHAHYYAEVLAFPFGPKEHDVPEHVQAYVLVSQWDKLRARRIFGTDQARRMLSEGDVEASFTLRAT